MTIMLLYTLVQVRASHLRAGHKNVDKVKLNFGRRRFGTIINA